MIRFAMVRRAARPASAGVVVLLLGAVVGASTARAQSATQPAAAPQAVGAPAPAQPAVAAPGAVGTADTAGLGAARGRVGPGRLELDPWTGVTRVEARTTRENLARIDAALHPYRTSYARLAPDGRARMRDAYTELFPRDRFTRTLLGEAQAEAVVYRALGPWQRDVPCEPMGPGRAPDRVGMPDRWNGGRASRCTAALDSLSLDAAWIRTTVVSLGRSAARRPRAEELGLVRDMAHRARAMVVTAPGCGCDAVRADADALLDATREVQDAVESSTRAAWMSLRSEQVQRTARAAEALDRGFLRCLGDLQSSGRRE